MDMDDLVAKAKQVGEKAQEMIEERGGTDALKEDAEELRDIVRGEGGLVDKAREAAEALREPGARD